MKSKSPNATVSRLYYRYKALGNKEPNDNYYNSIEDIKTDLRMLTRTKGAIRYMSKNNIIKLCTMESSLRFMPPHSFIMLFGYALDELDSQRQNNID